MGQDSSAPRAERVVEGCATYISAARSCGAPAMGRCRDCGKPFCLAHQGRTRYASYSDVCVSCLVRREAQAADLSAETRRAERRASVLGRRSTAVDRLVGLGSPGLVRRRFAVGHNQRPLLRDVPVSVDFAPAWPVGDIIWASTYDGEWVPCPSGITEENRLVIMDQTHVGERPVRDLNATMVVRPQFRLEEQSLEVEEEIARRLESLVVRFR
jgi:hypothetical protein